RVDGGDGHVLEHAGRPAAVLRARREPLSRPDLLTIQPPSAMAAAPSGSSGAASSVAVVDAPSGFAPAVATSGAYAYDATTARANDLALAYQAGGHSEALAELIELLRPLLRASLQRYTIGSLMLPAPLDADDLQQQSWIILDGLARRWDPAGGDF